jgi:hypothetical protein
VLLNAALLAALVTITFMPQAHAQSRVRSSYTIVGGTVNGIVQGVAYICDETTNEVVAVSWWENNKKLVGLGYRSVSADAASFGRTR